MLKHPKNQKYKENISDDEKDALHDLASDDSIIIQKADKGGAIVIMNTTDYIKEAERQLNNPTHYQETETDTTQTRTSTIRTKLKELEENDRLPEKSHKFLIPYQIRTSPFYLLPKIHKENNPGRPIVSGIDSPTDRISECLDKIFKPILRYIPSYVRDTKHFINLLTDRQNLHEDEFLVTIDVSSLYTSIPHDEGIEAIRLALRDHPSPFIDPDTATTLTELVLKNNTFKLNGKYYHQIQGTAMGTKMAPTYANILMMNLEKNLLSSSEITPNMWLRFIDDIFAIYRCTEDELIDQLEKLNQFHPTIKFTFSYSKTTANFLDTTVYVDENQRIQTELYRKQTDTNNYLHHSSYHPKSQKESIAYSITLRFKTICSTQE